MPVVGDAPGEGVPPLARVDPDGPLDEADPVDGLDAEAPELRGAGAGGLVALGAPCGWAGGFGFGLVPSFEARVGGGGIGREGA